MKSRLKILLGISLCGILLAAALSWTPGNAETVSLPAAQESDDTDEPMRTVRVTGVGEMRVEPDYALVRLGVQTDADTASEALDQNSTQMGELIEALRDAGIPANNIQTQTVRLNPRYESRPNNNNLNLVGYTAYNIVEVQTEDLDALGDLLDQAVTAGANTIETISFQSDNTDEQVDQVRELAVQNARHKAEELARLTNATLGSIVEVQEMSTFPGPGPRPFEEGLAAADVPISPGTQTISVQVQMTWTLVVNSEP